MAKPKPKQVKKIERSEGAIEATIAARFNKDGAIVEYECGECGGPIGAPEEIDTKAGKIVIAAGEEVVCGAEGCGKTNYNDGFTITITA